MHILVSLYSVTVEHDDEVIRVLDHLENVPLLQLVQILIKCEVEFSLIIRLYLIELLFELRVLLVFPQDVDLLCHRNIVIILCSHCLSCNTYLSHDSLHSNHGPRSIREQDLGHRTFLSTQHPFIVICDTIGKELRRIKANQGCLNTVFSSETILCSDTMGSLMFYVYHYNPFRQDELIASGSFCFDSVRATPY